MAPDDDALLREANRINYQLRSTFFYRKLREYGVLALPRLLSELTPAAHLYSWEHFAEWGIGIPAYHTIRKRADLTLMQVFCHPRALRERPQLVAYYRNIAALSQKGVRYLSGIDVKPLERLDAASVSLDNDSAMKLARLFNGHISLIVESALQNLAAEELYGLLLASTGAQIDGAWRNAIGEEAERIVRRLLARGAQHLGALAALTPRNGSAVELFDLARLDEQLGQIDRYRAFLLTNQTSLLFASEPDVSLLDPDGKTIGVIEVKGGADPAGALERYGAAKKSFESARRANPAVTTILVASCITAEVRARIEVDPTISAYYNLTELLNESLLPDAHSQFTAHVFALLGLVTESP